MKIKIKELTYEEAISKKQAHVTPTKQSSFYRKLMALLSKSEMKAVNFQYSWNANSLQDNQPCLFLMNHSSFTDLQIIATLLKNRPYHIVCTNDGFIGKEKLMRKLGCIPTKKFIIDVNLVRDMRYVSNTLKSSIVMFPEASYSFDGSQTPLPDSLGKCIRMLNMPVVMIKTSGAYLRDPLYNGLRKRKTQVSANIETLFTTEELKTLSIEEINDKLKKAFTYDHFREQVQKNIVIDEDFRAEGLQRALYKCPHCLSEGYMVGNGSKLICTKCNHTHTLTAVGLLEGVNNETSFEYVTDWYYWQREEVKREIGSHSYSCDYDVDIYLLTDFEAIYSVGTGHLHHDQEGFTLLGCDGKLDFKLSSKSGYSLYADYFWYELGDMICIGDTNVQYYCIPHNPKEAIVAKARLATEELYRLQMM